MTQSKGTDAVVHQGRELLDAVWIQETMQAVRELDLNRINGWGYALNSLERFVPLACAAGVVAVALGLWSSSLVGEIHRGALEAALHHAYGSSALTLFL